VELHDKKDDAVSESHAEPTAKRLKTNVEDMWIAAEDLFGNMDKF